MMRNSPVDLRGLRFVDVTTAGGNVSDAAMLAKCEPLHRQLRPDIPADYDGFMRAVFAEGGRMSAAVENGVVQAMAVWRIYTNAVDGRKIHIDDIVTDEPVRGVGVGKTLLDYLRLKAHRDGCKTMTLDPSVKRQAAHRFFFAHGLVVTSFSFKKHL